MIAVTAVAARGHAHEDHPRKLRQVLVLDPGGPDRRHAHLTRSRRPCTGAAVARSLGLVQAINLDGGGSTTMTLPGFDV